MNNMKIDLRLGDCLEVLKTIPDNSIDAVITDPPYGLSFMGKKWDYDVPSVEVWVECLRVLKPGGHLLSFAGSRTYHRMAVRIEDAGFEIRDQIMWVYGSGFPKSHNIGKAIDKRGGESIGWFGDWLREWREENNIQQNEVSKLFPSKTGGVTGCVANWEKGYNLPTNEQFNLICETFNLPFKSLEEAEREFIGTDKNWGNKGSVPLTGYKEFDITKGNSDWEGWGTALKPAHEPIVMARKPLSEKSIAENVLKHGTGGINIDGSRIGFTDGGWGKRHNQEYPEWKGGRSFTHGEQHLEQNDLGRFPANIIFDEEAGQLLDEQSGIGKSGKNKIRTSDGFNENAYGKGIGVKAGQNNGEYGDKGGASRFFYCPKAAKKDRNEGLDEFEDKVKDRGVGRTCSVCNKFILSNSSPRCECGENRIESYGTTKNNHPTVKPTDLMRYLINLITPPNGTILDPFMGSGSTGKAAVRCGLNFIGIEKEQEYMDIASARIEHEKNKPIQTQLFNGKE
jgi:DNA modification methylase